MATASHASTDVFTHAHVERALTVANLPSTTRWNEPKTGQVIGRGVPTRRPRCDELLLQLTSNQGHARSEHFLLDEIYHRRKHRGRGIVRCIDARRLVHRLFKRSSWRRVLRTLYAQRALIVRRRRFGFQSTRRCIFQRKCEFRQQRRQRHAVPSRSTKQLWHERVGVTDSACMSAN